jgi:hypothetical protein
MDKTLVNLNWLAPVTVHRAQPFASSTPDARNSVPGMFGSEYGRLLQLNDGAWLVVYTTYENQGYLADPAGGSTLEIAVSEDRGETWSPRGRIAHPSRDLDNGQMIELDNGDILLGCRSVRWHESYQLHVYKSEDKGKSWAFWSTIDEKNGSPGSLGNPDKGVYETHFLFLSDGRLSVMYASEKHVTEAPYYSQIISQKISDNSGLTWGAEIKVAWDPAKPQLRPGMPVWTRMRDGKYIMVHEVVNFMMYAATCQTYYKISDDGITWEAGYGTPIPDQTGGPYIECCSDGVLFVTSNSGNISVSLDDGHSWQFAESPFQKHLWPSLYDVGDGRIALLNSDGRGGAEGGHCIRICFGQLEVSP